MAETLRDLMYGAALRSQPMTQPPMLLPDTIQRLAMQQGGSIGTPQRSTLAQMLGNTGTAAQRLAAALDQYGARIPGTQARITLKDLTLGDAGQVMEDWSYGSPPTTGGNYATGGIGTMGVQPRAMDLLNLGGVAGGAVQAGKTGARVLGPTLREMTRRGADNAMRATGARLSVVPEGKVMSLPDEPPEGFVRLYSGSHEPIKEIRPDGVFGGIFASDDIGVANSHGLGKGRVTHKIDVPESAIASSRDLDVDNVESMLRKHLGAFSDDEFDDIYKAVIKDKGVHRLDIPEDRLLQIFRSSNLADASWEAQRVRGLLAKELGFKAVAMSDEHGISYLVLPGNAIAPVK